VDETVTLARYWEMYQRLRGVVETNELECEASGDASAPINYGKQVREERAEIPSHGVDRVATINGTQPVASTC
jgi:hypothetical protein